MIAKDTAKELINKYYNVFQKTDTCFGDCEEEYRKGKCTNSGHGCGIWEKLSKECALITVNEILKTIPYINNTQEEVNKRVYCIEVSQEINKL
jgi:hypothetical protein